VKLDGDYSVIGRSCVLHFNEDDLAKDASSESKAVNAG